MKTIILFLTMPKEDLLKDSKDPAQKKRDKDAALPDCEVVPFYIPKENWNQRLALWDGGAQELLEEILTAELPKIRRERHLEKEDVRFVIAGYSLAGLFSLWCLYQTDIFVAAVSCSGSFWYPQFKEYVITHELKRKCSIYLSLGTKEERSGSLQMRTVGDATREIYGFLQRQEAVEQVVLEWNPGNHFTDVDGRMRKGFAWIVENMGHCRGGDRMEQTERIQKMERLLEEGTAVVSEASEALGKYKTILSGLKDLEAYYQSEQWMRDLEDDQNGKFPADLKRGVLSEDAVWDLLEKRDRLTELLTELLRD